MILFCETCHEFFSESRMMSETLCDICEAREYLKKKGGENHKKEKSKALGDEPTIGAQGGLPFEEYDGKPHDIYDAN